MKNTGGGKQIKKIVKQTKIKILIILAVAIIVIATGILLLAKEATGILLLAKEAAKYSLEGAVFYFKGMGEKTKLFYLEPGVSPQPLIDLPSEEVNPGKYKVPKHSYISHNGETMIYFERVEEVPVGIISEEQELMAFRIIYKPKYRFRRLGFFSE